MQSKRKPTPGTNPQTRAGTSSRTLWQRQLRLGELLSPQSRLFNIKLQIVESEEYFSLPECHRDLSIGKLKNRLELFVGIPVNFQRIQYLDEDLEDESTLRKHEIVPGGTLTMRIWPEDSWGQLVAAAASGKVKKLQTVGVTQTSSFSTANSRLMTEEKRNDWLAHRAFVALFITAHRGHTRAVEYLLQNGADVKLKTPLGRTALHVAVTSGQVECISILLDSGARVSDEDNEGHNAVQLARLWKQRESERRLFRHRWMIRTVRSSQHQNIK
ncbi:ankyrin repeat domain-containing protein 60 isoform X2 [Pantherophis guttatus]|uniref:Ankyrin repeat domain-containing protein 60 isoform X2 n=1 Tax=Pantherophis guttatus TaxID=94885 RepID=A0A6P9D9K2_PANGU|nr:ankyrin repeat domain-containing protein 60 isoform X2 [Pantherophis guttatus]